jgi:transcription elongation factor
MKLQGKVIKVEGKVIKVEGNKITMKPKHDDLKDPLEFPAHEFKKWFRMGNHVKVISESESESLASTRATRASSCAWRSTRWSSSPT